LPTVPRAPVPASTGAVTVVAPVVPVVPAAPKSVAILGSTLVGVDAVAIGAGGNQKLGEDITGYMVNKALMSGDATKDVMDLYGSSGINFDTGHARLLEMEQSGALSKEQADALRFQLTRYLGQGTFKDQSGGNPMTFNVGDVNTSGRVLGDGEFVDAPVPVIAQPKDINYSDMASKALQKLQEKQK